MLLFLRYCVVILVLILIALLFLFVFLFRPFHPENSYWMVRVLTPIVFKILGIQISYQGQEFLKAKWPVIYIGNHQHNIDLFIFSNIVPKGTVCVAKKSLAWFPIFGWTLWLGGHFFINRKNHNSAIKKMDDIRNRIYSKMSSIIMMPEGTRGHGRGLGPFKKGAFRLALDTDLPICPIVSSSYHKFVNLNKWKAGKIIVEVLPPIILRDNSLKDLNEIIENTRNLMSRTIEKLDKQISEHTVVPLSASMPVS